MLTGILTEEEQNIMRDFDAEDLSRFAQDCEETRLLVYNRLKQNGVKINEYPVLEDFLRERRYDEV